MPYLVLKDSKLLSVPLYNIGSEVAHAVAHGQMHPKTHQGKDREFVLLEVVLAESLNRSVRKFHQPLKGKKETINNALKPRRLGHAHGTILHMHIQCLLEVAECLYAHRELTLGQKRRDIPKVSTFRMEHKKHQK